MIIQNIEIIKKYKELLYIKIIPLNMYCNANNCVYLFANWVIMPYKILILSNLG